MTAKQLHTNFCASMLGMLLATWMRDWRQSTNDAASGKSSSTASGVTGSREQIRMVMRRVQH